MLRSLEEIKQVSIDAHPVVNGVDSADLDSVDSTTPIITDVDEIKVDEEKKAGDAESSKKVDEKKVDEKKENEKKPSETKPEKDAIQKRIDAITKQRRIAERERDYEKTKRLELEEEIKKLKAQTPATDKPKKEDFEDEAAYVEALTDWKIEQKFKTSKDDTTKLTAEEEEKAVIAEAFEDLETIMGRGREKYDDFDTLVLNKDLLITPEITELILQSEQADELMYYLGKNPLESEEISKLSPLKAAKRLIELEAELVEKIPKENDSQLGDEEKEKEKPPVVKKKTSNAPPPITPVKATGVTEQDPSKMSPKEYRAWRESNKG